MQKIWTRPRSTQLLIFSIAAFLAWGVAACVMKDDLKQSSKSKSDAVTIKTFAFNPNPLKIKAGTKVTWTNNDEILHTVTSGKRDHANGTFDHNLDGKGTAFSYTFTKAGTYYYHCMRHPGMDAEVDVN